MGWWPGNVLIAVGPVLPGIGGAATRAGHTEVLHVAKLVGLILTWLGYPLVVGGGRGSGAVATPPFP